MGKGSGYRKAEWVRGRIRTAGSAGDDLEDFTGFGTGKLAHQPVAWSRFVRHLMR